LPSLTPIWRSAEFQEREIFDLYGIRFDGHPDLRRILMWDEFEDHPMRKDYREPDDYEYEPTPHDEVLERAKQHYAPRPHWTARKTVNAISDYFRRSRSDHERDFVVFTNSKQ
jgi:NADH:ubiquinone oxidoreductase subunit C